MKKFKINNEIKELSIFFLKIVLLTAVSLTIAHIFEL